MQSAQGSEIALGIAITLTTFVFFCFYAGFFLGEYSESSGANSFAAFLLLVWLFSLMVAFGAYFDSVKPGKITLTILLIGSTFVTVTLGCIGLIVLVWGGIFALFPLIPAVLSALTAILALQSRRKTSSQEI